jgi:hypothetical protein
MCPKSATAHAKVQAVWPTEARNVFFAVSKSVVIISAHPTRNLHKRQL